MMKKHHALKQMEKDSQETKEGPPEESLLDNTKQDNLVSKFLSKQSKQTRLIILISVIGLLIFTLIATITPFKDTLFNLLYPKPVSQASDPIDDLTRQLLESNNQVKLIDQSIGVTGESTPSPTAALSATPTASPAPTSTSTPTSTQTPTSATSSAAESTQSVVQGESTNPKLQEKQKVLTDMVDIAKRRKELLLEKIRSNPQEFLNKTTLVNQRDQLPKEVQPYIEEKVSTQGELVIFHGDDFENKKSINIYNLKTTQNKDKKNYVIYFTKEPSDIKSGTKVNLSGVALDQEVVVTSVDSSVKGIQSSGEVLQAATTDLKVAVILAKFQNTTTDPQTKEYFNSLVFTGSKSTKKFFEEISFNKLSFNGSVFGWYQLPFRVDVYSPCDLLSWMEAADNQAQAAGVNLANYNRIVYVLTDRPITCASGMANIDSAVIFTLPGHMSLAELFGHEIGHTLNLNHANFLNCYPHSLDILSNCRQKEYGDSYSTMGWGGLVPFSAPHKVQLGWNVSQTITSSDTYTIYPLETLGSSPQVLKIPIGNNNHYYLVSYRQPIGFASSFSGTSRIIEGASVHLAITPSASFHESLFLDAVPKTELEDPLKDGDEFVDQINNISIKQINHIPYSSNTNPGSVTVEVKIDAAITSSRAFVTSTTYNGNLGGISGADSKCQQAANDSTRYPDLKNIRWKAWLSDSTTSAASRLTPKVATSYKLVNDAQIASSWFDFTDGMLSSPINIDENGNTVAAWPMVAWTNTNKDGNILLQSQHCNNWTSADPIPRGAWGFIGSKEANWTSLAEGFSAYNSGCHEQSRLYCFEESMFVPQPDLIVESVSPTGNLGVGATASFYIVIKNIGQAIASHSDSITVQANITKPNGQSRGACVWRFNDLAAGASITPSQFIGCLPYDTAGQYKVVVEVDPAGFRLDRISESNETNNTREIFVNVSVPSPTPTPTPTPTPIPTPPPVYLFGEFLETFGTRRGDAKYVEKYDYNNDGRVSILDWSVLVYKFTPQSLQLRTGYSASELLSTYNKSSTDSGFISKYDVNTDNIVNKPDYVILNTVATPTPTPTPTPTAPPKAPDLVVNSVRVSGTPRVKRKNSINVVIQNKGNLNVKTRGTLALRITQPNNTLLGNCNGSFASPSVNKTTRVQVRNCPAFKTPGSHTITATVDSTNTIPESNENNNQLSTTINVR